MKDLKIHRKWRKKSFQVKWEYNIHPVFPKEIFLSITHNGYQWTSIYLSKEETKKVIECLQDYLKGDIK